MTDKSNSNKTKYLSLTDTFDAWFDCLRDIDKEKVLKHIKENYQKNLKGSNIPKPKSLQIYCPKCYKKFYKKLYYKD